MSEQTQQIALRLLRPDFEVVVTPLYVPEPLVAELVLGTQARLWRPDLVRQLERDGLPRKRQLFGTMRYLPGVFDFFAKREGLRSPSEDLTLRDGPENFGA